MELGIPGERFSMSWRMPRVRFDIPSIPALFIVMLRRQIPSSLSRFTQLTHACPQLPSSRTTRAGSAANIPLTANPRRIEVSTLPTVLNSLETRLDTVNKTLNDEIQLLIGSVTVRDAETSMKQAERATILTLLAAVYLPLQLVTGIFGMNIAEINDGIPAWRACVVALAVAGGLTLGGFGIAWWWRKRREGLRIARERGRAKMV